jgi:hypothetical protein
MKNRWLLVVLAILLVSWLITGCGISQSQYDAVAAELEKVKQGQQASQSQLLTAKNDLIAVQTELLKTQNDLNAAKAAQPTSQAEINAVKTQLQTAQSELTKTKIDLQTAQSQLQSLQKNVSVTSEKFAKALKYSEISEMLMYEGWLAARINPGYTFASMQELKTALMNKANGLEDSALNQFIGNLKTGDPATMYTLLYYSLQEIQKLLK